MPTPLITCATSLYDMGYDSNGQFLTGGIMGTCNHRRRIDTQEKPNVGATVWGTEFIQLLAMLPILHQDDMKKRMNCARMKCRK